MKCIMHVNENKDTSQRKPAREGVQPRENKEQVGMLTSSIILGAIDKIDCDQNLVILAESGDTTLH